MDYSITKEKYNALNQGNAATNAAPAVAGKGEDDGADSDGDGMDVDSDVDVDGGAENDDGNDSEDDSEHEGEEEQGQGQEGGPDAGAGLGRTVERQRRAPDVNHGCTIFVRNVAFDCGQEEVKERFSEFGEVRLALLVKDRNTGMPRGTAFVKVRCAHRMEHETVSSILV